jgi:hypothetical protein
MNSTNLGGWPNNVTGPGAWTNASLAADKSWIHQLTPQWLQAIDRIIIDLRKREVTLDTLCSRRYRLPRIC